MTSGRALPPPRRPDRGRARPRPPARRPTRAACACLAALRVMPWTSWPAAARRGTNCFPIAPVAPATKTRIVISLIGTTTTRQGGPRGCDTCPMLRYELLDRALSNHLLPDPVLLLGSRAATARRLRSEREGGVEAQEDRLRSLLWHMSHGPIAEVPEHTADVPGELPGGFYALFLGPRHKYSRALEAPGSATSRVPRRRCSRSPASARRSRTGWRSWTSAAAGARSSLYLGERYPQARITGVSNSPAAHAHRGRRGRAA